MHLRTAILCDFAQVREGLLFVASGGISRVIRPSYPAPASFALALMLELDAVEVREPHEIRVRIMAADEPIGEMTAGFQINDADLHPGERQNIPVPVNLHNVPLPAPGGYSITISVDDRHVGELAFFAVVAQG